MKNSVLYILFLLLLSSSCTDNFEEMGNLLSQQFTMVDFNLFDRHDLSSPQLGGNPWPTLYTNLRDNELLLAQSRANPISAVYEGPALILKAYLTAALTDIYGDVPYFDAVQGKAGIVNPSYDNQADIYQTAGGILDNLDQGIAAIENYVGTQSLDGDIILGGDLNRWTKLGNSLKIKYLLRISEVVDVAEDLQSIYDNGNYIQESNDNATFDFLATQPNTFRLSVLRAGDFNLFVLSETMQEIFSELNDPRVGVLFRPASNSPGAFRGLVSASLNNDLIPVRMPYPAEEAALNSQNYEEAISVNRNSVNSRVWWDVD